MRPGRVREIEIVPSVPVSGVRRPHEAAFLAAPRHVGGPDNFAVVGPMDHVVRGEHVVLVHQVAAPRRVDVMGSVHIQAPVGPDMGGRVGRVQMGDERIVRHPVDGHELRRLFRVGFQVPGHLLREEAGAAGVGVDAVAGKRFRGILQDGIQVQDFRAGALRRLVQGRAYLLLRHLVGDAIRATAEPGGRHQDDAGMRRKGLENAHQALGVVRELLVDEYRILRLAVVSAQVDEDDVRAAGEGFAQPAFRPVGEVAMAEHRAGAYAVILYVPVISEQGLRLGGIGFLRRAGRAGTLGDACAHKGHPYLGLDGQGGENGHKGDQSFHIRFILRVVSGCRAGRCRRRTGRRTTGRHRRRERRRSAGVCAGYSTPSRRRGSRPGCSHSGFRS